MSGTASRARHALPVLPVADPVPSGPRQPSRTGGPSVRLVTLGCDKNTVDSERLLARLVAAGASPACGDADVLVVNTCGFIDRAKEESIDAILAAIRVRDAGRAKAVVALGCMVQRYKSELAQELPEVDLFLGLTEVDQLVPELRRRGLLDAGWREAPNMERPLRRLTRAGHTSFLKISEGCDHACAFCAIPLMRGKHRSTPIDTLVREARELEALGVVELGLVSQDTTWYGRDVQRGVDPANGDPGWFIGRPFAGMAGGPALAAARAAPAGRPGERGRRGLLTELLRALLAETAIPWLRLFYMYPSGISRELVELIAAEPRIVDYLDMPIQHGSDAVLRRMRRPERQATIRERVRWLRSAIPDIALRTTVIAGFPGETEEDFGAMLELLEELRFDHVGAFAYSVEADTPAATMADPVSEGEKRERLERLFDLQRSIAQDRNDELVGREATVLIDRVPSPARSGSAPAPAVGRTARQAMEIDGVVYVTGAGRSARGDFVRVRITNAFEQDLEAELVRSG